MRRRVLTMLAALALILAAAASLAPVVYVAGYMLVGLLDFCLLVWAVAEVRRARREKLAGRTITGTPTQIARWVKQTTGVPVKAQNVKGWLRRGHVLAVSKPGKGIYECDMSDLLQVVETVHPGLKLTA